MITEADIASITKFALPDRLDVNIPVDGLQVVRLDLKAQKFAAKVQPFRTRNDNVKRALATTADGKRFLLEVSAMTSEYPNDVEILRGREFLIQDDTLTFSHARFLNESKSLNEANDIHTEVTNSWRAGIAYVNEITDNTGVILRPGLRIPQIGALHAIAAHWSLSSERALVVMPTGTGKTEVMIAAGVADAAKRILIIVPTDPLRSQTAEKFLNYGLLKRLGIIGNYPNPVVGILSRQPKEEHFESLRACNVVVTTMSSIGLANAETQASFANIFSHIFFDEAHHIEAATWKRFREFCSHARVLMFTATPFREDGKPLDGKIIYNFPLRAAQSQGYFKPIHFLEVFEPDSKLSDLRIAQAAVGKLRQYIAAGLPHLLMARTSTIKKAEALYTDIYENFHDLNPIVLHSQTRNRAKVLKDIRSGIHKIIVCVDMFGEGFDLPNLKIAALHDTHKSIGITLQYIGRFARAGSGVGDATFVANIADEGVPEALEALFQENSNWNDLLADLSFDSINPQAQLSELVGNLEGVGAEKAGPEISMIALRPKISAQVYRTTDFFPERYTKAFTARQQVFQPHISRHDNFLVLVVNQQDSLDWTDSRDIAADVWDLYLAYFDPENELLYVHCSRKGSVASSFARALSTAPQLISGEEVFKSFSGLNRLVLHSVGLTSQSKNVRFQMFVGLDVRDAIDPIVQHDKMKSVVTGVGYEEGKRKTVGCSKKGKFWSMNSGSIAQWKVWCDSIGEKLNDNGAQADEFLQHTLVPSLIETLPEGVAIMADWPDQLFEFANFRFEVRVTGGGYHSFDDCEINLQTWPETGGTSFSFTLSAGEEIEVVFELTIQPPTAEGRESTYEVRKIEGPDVDIVSAGRTWTGAGYFIENPPLIRLADGSQLSGNIFLKPRAELLDTFERENIEVFDWTGVDITAESRWKDGALRPNSIQQKFAESLLAGPATIVFDDDDTGESADLIAIEETETEIIINLWHCKYSGGEDAGRRAGD
jgi:superfamily II DNA or RNA helicase